MLVAASPPESWKPLKLSKKTPLSPKEIYILVSSSNDQTETSAIVA